MTLIHFVSQTELSIFKTRIRFFEKVLLYHSFRPPSIAILHRQPVEDAFNSEILYPSCLRLKALKTGILCSATPTRQGQIRECPLLLVFDQ